MSAVHVRIRKANGSSWNGSSWVAGDYWLPTNTSDGYAHWSYAWTPSSVIGQVSITARATDVAGLTASAGPVSSQPSGSAAVSIDDGAAYTTDTDVSVATWAPGLPNKMRWSNGTVHERLAGLRAVP